MMPLGRGRGRVGYQYEFCLNKDHSKAVREALKKEYPQMKIRVKIDDCNSILAWLVSGNQKLNDDNFEPVKEAIEQTMMDALKTFDDTKDERVNVFCYLGDWTKNQDYIQNAESSAMTYNAEMDANVLFRQLGGNRFRAMTGAKDFMKDGNSLRMKIMKNNTGGNHLIITLNPNDLYDMRFESHRLNRKTYELTIKVKAEEKNIPASDLQRVFTRLSGLYTRMAEQSFNAEGKKKKSGCMHYKYGKHKWAYTPTGKICIDCGNQGVRSRWGDISKWQDAEQSFNAEYEVVQIFPNGYEQHISIADTLDDAKKDIEEFPHKWRHYGPLEIKKRAEQSFKADEEIVFGDVGEGNNFGQNRAETFGATKGIDTFTEPLEEVGIPLGMSKWIVGIGGVAAAIFGINYLGNKIGFGGENNE